MATTISAQSDTLSGTIPLIVGIHLGMLLVWSGNVFADSPDTTHTVPVEIRYPIKQTERDVRNDYFIDLLQAALKTTENDFGPYVLVPHREFIHQDRMFWLLSMDSVYSVAWAMTSKQREAQARPVRIPLVKGLLGVRVAIVRKDKLDQFRNIRSIDDLKSFVALQGHDWPDTRILQANGLKVETDFRYREVFKLIELGRYDYFPRGIIEAYEELKVLDYPDLTVVPDFALTYPAPVYFYVSYENEALAQRLETGLNRLTESGKFDDMLRNHPRHREAIKLMNLEQRRLIKLTSPVLPEPTPLENTELWWKPDLFVR